MSSPGPPLAEPLSPPALRLLVAEMPKAELHVHLDGALRIDTALELAATRLVAAPSTYGEMVAALVAPSEPRPEADLLSRFELPVRLLQDAEALDRVTRELVAAKAADCVRYLEIKWAPRLHTRRGLSVRDVIEAVCRAARAAGLATGTEVRLTCVAVRSHSVADNVALAKLAAEFVSAGLTGFDLAGSEADDPDPRVHRAAFDTARAGGLRITVHAGDLPGSARNVWQALELEPERIAHGVAAADDLELCDEIAVRGIGLDLCPTSNFQSGTIPRLADHPLARLHRRGVPVTISTDDPTISAVRLSDEFVTAVQVLGLTPAELWAINLRAVELAFADAELVDRLRSAFLVWAAAVPELAAEPSVVGGREIAGGTP
jgi:adenosine deaminase